MLLELFKKKRNIPDLDFSSLKVDMHSHLIPGIDDGAQTMEDSLVLLRRLSELGYKKVITTPHVMADFYRNTPEIINNGLELLKKELVRNNINIEIEASAEYYLDEAFEVKLEKETILPLGENYLLFELSFINYPQSFFEIVEKIKAKGYKPILAHPERYGYLGGAIENYERIKKAGCDLQLNVLSLTGYYGKQCQRVAEELVANQLIDFLGTDLHHHKHADMLFSALNTSSTLKKLLAGYPLKNSTLL